MKVKMGFTGDVLCSPGLPELVDGDFRKLFEKVEDRMRSYDFLVVNPESPFAGEKFGYTNARYEFNSPESLLTVLKENGADLVSLANNHCMDRGEAGIPETLKNCHAAGLDTVGIYASEEERSTPYIRDFGGLRVAFLNYTYGTNAFSHRRFIEHSYSVNLLQPEETLPGSIRDMHMNDMAQMALDVKRIYGDQGREYEAVRPYLLRLECDIKTAKENADYVIMLMHSGGQYNAEPDAFTKMMVKNMVSWGVDLVVGNHPHILQSCGTEGDVLTIYSLGNMIYRPDMVGHAPEFSDVDHTYNALFELELTLEEGKITEKRAFRLLQVLLKDGVPYVVDTYEAFGDGKDPEKTAEILAYANLFAGGLKKYDKMQALYEL